MFVTIHVLLIIISVFVFFLHCYSLCSALRLPGLQRRKILCSFVLRVGLACLKALLGDRVWDISPRSQLMKKQKLAGQLAVGPKEGERERGEQQQQPHAHGQAAGQTGTSTSTNAIEMLPQSALLTASGALPLPDLGAAGSGPGPSASASVSSSVSPALGLSQPSAQEAMAMPRAVDSPPRVRRPFRDHDSDDKVRFL